MKNSLGCFYQRYFNPYLLFGYKKLILDNVVPPQANCTNTKQRVFVLLFVYKYFGRCLPTEEIFS